MDFSHQLGLGELFYQKNGKYNSTKNQPSAPPAKFNNSDIMKYFCIYLFDFCLGFFSMDMKQFIVKKTKYYQTKLCDCIKI